MKTKLFTQNACFAILITLALVLGVQESVYAISSTGIRTNIPGSGVNPLKVEVRAGQEFEITLTFSLQGRTRIRVAGEYQDDSDPARTVDSAGYVINDNGHRTLTDTGQTYVANLAPEAEYNLQARDPNGLYANPTAPYFSNSSRSVYDASGYPVYPYRAAAPNDTPPVTAHAKSQVKALAAHWTKVTPEKKLYYYDEEQITIDPTNVTLRLKGGHPIDDDGTPLLEAIVGEAKPAYELTRSVTLVCSATADGSFTVTNTTPNTDYPANAAERQRDDGFPATDRLSKLVEFTVLVLPTPSVETNSFLSTSQRTVRIDELFLNATNGLIQANLNSNAADTVVYEIIRGDGHLYTETDATPYTQFTRHESLEVYIDLNETDNEISAYVTGHFDGRKILPIRYTGTDRRATGSNPTPRVAPTGPQNIISLSSPSTGEPGEEITVSVTSDPSGRFVTLESANIPAANFSPRFGTTPFPSTILLPSEERTYSITASSAGLRLASAATVRVETSEEDEAEALGTLSISTVGAAVNRQQTVEVSARDANGAPVGGVQVTLTGSGISRTVTTLSTGSTRAIIGIPATASYTVTLTADGYETRSVSLSAGIQQPGQPTQPSTQQPAQPSQPPSTVSEPDSIKIGGPATRTGTVNEALEAPLLVQVLDADGDGFENAIVTFRVKRGQARLSERGDGQGISARTDSQGFARATLTPLSSGRITVEAEARGVRERVTFTITTGLAPATIEPGTEDPTPSTTVSPVVNPGVDASSRPPMLWISGGKIYALVGSKVKLFISNVENATNLAVGGGKVYWTAQTSDTDGTLNSANLDGTDAKQLRTLWGVPRGITLDPTGSKLYWVDAANRLQRSDLDGSNIQNILKDLSDPKHVALSRGNAYWIGNGNGTDTLSFINLSDPRKEINPIAATSGIYGGLAIANGKLYWTEQTSDTHGMLHSVNLDGTGAKELWGEPIWGAPMGIAVDTARSRLYWTDAVGRLQRSDTLDVSRIYNVAKGLGRLGDIVLSNSIAEPAGTTPTTTTPTASKSKYDVNGDGVVDNIDAGLVSQALNTTNAKYDVNDDGVVNFFDLLLVFDNRDAGAAGAPTLLGMKLTAAQVAGIEEQIELLIATGDRSPTALKTLIYLQQLLATARPEKTQLLANYPNPFNPETWIPYELATDTDVRITIYNAQGVVIRTLQLGQQSAGYYTDREQAAYWDGRNALGEQVASGIYFYQLQTDEMSTLRKMVILK